MNQVVDLEKECDKTMVDDEGRRKWGGKQR